MKIPPFIVKWHTGGTETFDTFEAAADIANMQPPASVYKFNPETLSYVLQINPLKPTRTPLRPEQLRWAYVRNQGGVYFVTGIDQVGCHTISRTFTLEAPDFMNDYEYLPIGTTKWLPCYNEA